MIATIINSAAVVAGGLIGLLAKRDFRSVYPKES